MKNLKLLLITALILLYAKSAQSSCNASFIRAISGLTVTFTNTSSTTSGFPSLMTYNWSFGDGTYSTLKNPVKTYATGGVKGIQLFINDSFGCTHLAIDTFILVAPPTCNASFTKLITGGSGFTAAFTNTSYSSSGSNAIRYTWNFYNYNYTDTITSSLKNPTITFPTLGTKHVRLTMYDSISSCTASKTDSIILYNGLACQALFGKTISNLNVTLNNNSINAAYTNTGLTYLWQFSDGTSSTAQNLVKTFATGGIKTIRLTIQDSAHFCTHTRLDTVFLTAPVSCTASFTKSISGLSVAFTNTSTSSSGSNAIAYYWYFSDGTSSSLKNPTKVFSTIGNKTAQLTMYDSITSCTATFTDTFLLVSPILCSPRFTSSISGLSVTFTNNTLNSMGTTTGLTYLWQFSDATSATTRDVTKTFASAGIETVRLTIGDSLNICGGTRLDSLILTGGLPGCSASFTKTISGSTVSFINTSLNSNGTATGLTYYWYFNEDGTVSTLKNPVKTFLPGGFKRVVLTITDTLNSCSSSIIDSVYLGSTTNCNARFTRSTANLTLTLSNGSYNSMGTTAGLMYSWLFSDNTSSTQKDIVKTFSTGGYKTVQLTLSDSANTCSAIVRDSFILNSTLCRASFTKSISGSTVTFTNTSINGNGNTAGLAYYWSFSQNPNTSVKDPVVTFPSNGFKQVNLEIYDSLHNCSSYIADSFLIGTLPNCLASFNRVCVGLSVYFENKSIGSSGTNAISYYWSFSDSTNSTEKSPDKVFTSPGLKYATLTIYDSITSCTSTITDPFYLGLPPHCLSVANRTQSNLTVYLKNMSVNSSGTPTGLTYLWQFSDSTTSTSKNPTKTFATGGFKKIQLTIFDSINSCTDIRYDSLILVAPTPLCSASFALAIDTTTPFSFFLLNTSLIRPGSSFYWNFGDGGSSTSMTPTHAYATFGKYLVCLTVSDSVCTSTFCDSIGMDSTGHLLKKGGFSFRTLDFTKLTGTTGLVKMAEPMQYHVYPNPSAGELNVEVSLREATPLNFELMDISGKVLATKSIGLASGNYKESLDLSELKPSIYFLSIRSNQGVSTFKVIKN